MIFSLKNVISAVLLMWMFIIPVSLTGIQDNEAYFLSHPALSPNGETIVFSYEEDLWTVPAVGGAASRLTGMQGEEINPRWSPDGQWIAFSGRQDGNFNIFIIPVAGGEIRQLTVHESADIMESWAWDSKSLYFTSGRENDFTTYETSITGGTPKRLFGHYFNTPHALVRHPITGACFFTDSWESNTMSWRKRYKGDYNPDIKSWDPKREELKVHAPYRGKDLWPSIDRHGNLYFASDRSNGQYNLFRLEGDNAAPLTAFDTPIKTPSVSADGRKVVFEKDFRLFILDVKTLTSERVAVHLPQNQSLHKNKEFDIDGKITHMDVSPDGKKFAFSARGELFVSDIKGKFIKKIKTAPEGRVTEVTWLKDNKTLIFTQTADGWYNLFKISADKNEKETQLTFDKANNRNISLNGERTRLVFLSGTREIRLMDLTDFSFKTIIRDELWGIYNNLALFSPDDRYIVFEAMRNMETDIMVYDLENQKSLNLTDSGISESEPFWSPDGKYLYFSSKRFSPSYPNGNEGARIFRLPLDKHPENFRSTEYYKLFKEEKKEETKEEKKDKNSDKSAITAEDQKTAKPRVSIMTEDLELRWEVISPNSGSQGSPFVIQKEGATIVLYISDHGNGTNSLWKTELKDFEETKTEIIKGVSGRFSNFAIAAGPSDKYYLLFNGKIGELDIKGNEYKPIAMSYKFSRNLADEFQQMFFELWATVGENFYDEKLHGVDWLTLRQKFSLYLPHVRGRNNLRALVLEMLGELNASHLGFYSNGDEEKTAIQTRSIATGLLFDPENPYTTASVVRDSPLDKKGLDVRAGDVLEAVNGERTDKTRNRETYFIAPSLPEEITLTFRRGDKSFDVTVKPISASQFRELIYNEWIRDCQRRVDTLSENRIAYIHMKDMGDSSLENFLTEITTEWYRKDALILDLRYNTGGNVHDRVLNMLIQRPYSQWKYRDGGMSPQPNFAPAAKPIVLLINAQSLSDAEMTAAGFKALKLGKIIGTETYRWLIFTSGKALVDGSFFRLPSWGCYTLEGKNIESEGVAPDIYIENTFRDLLKGLDPQLERAIAEIKKDWEKK